MTILILCLFSALLLPLLAKAPVAFSMAKLGGYNNYHPREQQSKLTGFGARALAAHQNAFESVILFAPAVILALATGNTQQSILVLAVVHVVSRVLYNILYLLNMGLLRSVIWAIATFCSFAIVFQCMP
ncbi:MAPEG family protein [Colwellia psychrerythraea]|uniref:Membrane-associated protein in eicosanoid and glutathione metabolism (MAPEG) n=1 Tax=Colwellia psychrerythraea TaxID=28229 RepID=A0A099KQA5_COLPS|nr:MAPEG family protein [Colwellia psychrerythraea]KGJ91853.1 membrane-associated protein in eicosanoid and glutathione metabolism (MAPEG) [Colwellia psychrerythraea]